MTEAVLKDQDGSILWLTLNQPETLNAMNLDLIEGLSKGVELASASSIRCMVIKGNGRGFCSGGDLGVFRKWRESGNPIPAEMPNRLHQMIEKLRRLEKPVLAVLHGPCAGAGTSLALATDLILAAEDTKLNLAYTRVGLSPDGSSTFFLPRHVGLKRAAEIFISGRTLSAREAQEWGLVNWVVPIAELEAKSKEIANQLAAGPTAAFARTKRLLSESFHHNLHDQLELETRMILESSQTDDFGEGLASFFEKRPPRFTGI